MKLLELFEDVVLEEVEEFNFVFEAAKPIWRRQGNKIVRGYRCTSGRKQGRIVSSPGTCGGKIDIKKRMRLKKLIMQKGKRMRRKAQRIKKKNPVSKRLRSLNKRVKG